MFKLPALPYAYEALQPTMSAETLHIHHDKHHAKYVDTLNTLLKDSGQTGPLEDVIATAKADGSKKVFNNAAQAWNHAFFWDCMSPAGGAPSGDLAALIAGFEGGAEGLKAKFVAEGVGHFGSGWVWLAVSEAGLKVASTHDGENLLDQPGLTPLFVADLWEHAYYVDYRNDREGFLKAWYDKLINWEFAGKQLAASKGKGDVWAYPA
jgi:Fe-Mn family superoxide dismutase